MPLNPGDTLVKGRYRIKRRLGRGGYGLVYEARDTVLRTDVAIKELRPDYLGDEAQRKSFLREAKATRELRHRRIVGTHDLLSESGSYYIVMEYMAGGSLEGQLQECGPLPIDEAIRVATQVCEGLSYAHKEGVVHCDLKPDNVLFDARGQAKVADFGIAHISREILTSLWKTSAELVAGTLPYMSPEQAEGVRDDPRVDIYALGAVLFRMLTGRTYLDFDERDTPVAQADNVYRIRKQQPVPPSTHNTNLPQWLDGVVLRALAKRPEDRFQTASELRAELSEPTALEGEEEQRTLEPVPSRISLPVWFWLAAGAAAVLLVIIVVAVAGLQGGVDGEQALAPTTAPGLAATSQTHVPQPSIATEYPRATSTLAPSSTPQPSTATDLPRPATTLAPTSTPQPPTRTPSPTPTATPARSGRIAFGSVNDDNWEIYAMNADGSGLTNLTHNPANDRLPDLSPDGRRIAFESDRDGSWDIYVMNADGSGQTQLTDSPEDDLFSTWSPDGRRIAFMSNRDGNWEIYVMHADGSVLANLTNDRGADRYPGWSPGARIAFHSDRDGNYEIYVMDAGGSGLTRLTHNADVDSSAAWSPDGRQIAFHSDRDGNYEIYVMNADGSEQTRLTDNPADDNFPEWSPNGTHIAFVSERDGHKEVYVMNVDGSRLTRLTDSPADDDRPSWSP